MKLFIKLRNKFFTVLASLALLVLSSLGLFNLCTPQSVDASMINFENENAITISNGSFKEFSSQSTFPYTPKSFTTSGNSTPNMKTGAISVADGTYRNNYENNYGLKEYDNPGDRSSNDDYILMINTGAGHSSNYTYTSSEFTLGKNGYYYVTVSAMTLGNGAVASVYLTQDDKVFENCIIENISATAWSNYTFFVATNSYEDVKLKFNMQIGNTDGGASGCVFFDELHAGQISAETMYDYMNNPNNANTYKFAEFRTPNAYKKYSFDNNIVTYPRNSKGELTYKSNGDIILDIENKNYFSTSTSGFANKNFEIANNAITLTAEDSYITYKGDEELLDANSSYKFSIWVKASELSKGSAFVQVDEIIDDSEEYDDFMESTTPDMTPKSSSLMISSMTTNVLTDGYVEYSVYVHTGALSSSKVQFSFGLGTETENATGNVTFKDFSIDRIPYSAYSAVSTGSTIGTIDIASRISLNSNEYSNYTFDKMKSESFDGIAYPATPNDWTPSNSGDGTQLSGVVNLSAFDKVMAKYSYINTMSTPSLLNGTANNNVLMIYNGTNSNQSYSSTSKSLTASKYYKVTAFVNTYISGNSDNGATIVAKTGSNVLGIADNINTYGNWQKVEFYINTPANNVDLTLELALGYGNKPASGYVFFDNILVEESDTENEFGNRFNEYVVAENGKVEIDLTNPMLTSSTEREFNTPILYKGENKGNTTVNAGVVDLNGELKMIHSSKHAALKDVAWANKNVFAIFSSLNEDSYYQYSSVIDYSFASGSYYRLSFDLFTDGIGQEDKEEKYDNNVLAQGVNIELTNLENAKFSYITSDGKWTHYEIYVGVDSTVNSTFKFALGSEFTGCYGRVFLGNIELATIEQAEFDATTAQGTILKVSKTTADNDPIVESSSKSGSNFSWVYIPTIATFLAIVAAVVGVFVRRNVKFKKRVKSGKAEYDREITVMQNKYRRLAQDQRAKDIREMTKECEELIALRSEYEEKYKEALSRLRSTRLANRDGSKRHEINAIEHEVKHISKEVARFGIQVNNYENEIEFMQTEAYLIDLEKRMMREDTLSRNRIRKEAEMSEEDRAEAIAKREAKQAQREEKAQAKADKLIQKQQKLQQQREEVQLALQQAKALDEKYMKEQELKQIKLEEIKLAKQKAKAEREIQKLERKRAQEAKLAETEVQKVESETQQTETEVQSTEVEEKVENAEVQEADNTVEVATEVESSTQAETQTEVETVSVEEDNTPNE